MQHPELASPRHHVVMWEKVAWGKEDGRAGEMVGEGGCDVRTYVNEIECGGWQDGDGWVMCVPNMVGVGVGWGVGATK